MFLATVLLCHVLGAIGVGPTFTLPFLADKPAALHVALISLRFGAAATLLSGMLLWLALKPLHPLWLYLSCALFLTVIASIAVVLSPAAPRVSDEPEMRRRVRFIGLASSASTVGIAALMVLRPSWS